MDFSHVRTKSLTETFIDYVEKLILSGELAPGEKLPPERVLAEKTGVSRPVVHESLVKLEAEGLVTIVARHGAYVTDFRLTGSLDVLSALLRHQQLTLTGQTLETLFEMRGVVDLKASGLAAIHATIEDLSKLEGVLLEQQKSMRSGSQDMARADFAFHHALCKASGEASFSFIMNAFSPLHTALERLLFGDPACAESVFSHHRRIVDALMAHDASRARLQMQQLIELSRSRLFETSTDSSSESL
jgi:GntR family transcriptional repressor for pyruvate dehydrogenase complex